MLFYNFLRFVCSIFVHILFRIQSKNIECFPKDGAVIIYSNHKSMWDPVIIACILKRPVFFMAKQELFEHSIMGFVFRNLNAFPVKRGMPDRRAIRKALEILNKKQVLGIFPEGTRSKDGKLQEPEPGIAMLAAKSKKVVLVPVAIKGNYKFFTQIDVIFGKPINFDKYHQKHERLNSKELKQISKDLFAEVSKLM